MMNTAWRTQREWRWGRRVRHSVVRMCRGRLGKGPPLNAGRLLSLAGGLSRRKREREGERVRERERRRRRAGWQKPSACGWRRGQIYTVRSGSESDGRWRWMGSTGLSNKNGGFVLACFVFWEQGLGARDKMLYSGPPLSLGFVNTHQVQSLRGRVIILPRRRKQDRGRMCSRTPVGARITWR